jgi:hypothetical protein
MTDNNQFVMEPVGEHAFLIRFGQGADVIEIVLHLDPATMATVAPDDIDERRVSQETLAFLTERQRADDLPASLDLADVAAAYDDWVDQMRTRLEREGQAAEPPQRD